MQKTLFAIILIFCLNSSEDLLAGSAGRNYTYETQEIVLYPTAGLTNNNSLLDFKFIGDEVFILSLETIVFKQFSMGISMAFDGLLGNRTHFAFKDYPALKLKYRILDESRNYPAIMVGFDSGNFIDIPINSSNKYHFSIGPFIVLSKAFSWQLGIMGIHLGANLPIEYNTNKYGNFYFGIEHSLNRFASVAIEYDFNGAYNRNGSIRNGILNLGLKYSIDRNVTLQFYIVDILSNNFENYKVFNLQFVSNLF